MEYGRERLVELLLTMDEEATLLLGTDGRRFPVVIVGGSAFLLHDLTNRPTTHDVDVLSCHAALRGVLAHGENGLAYRCREEFVDFADRLLGDDALRRRLGERSAATAEGFSANAFASSMSEVYRAAIRTIMAITD